MPPVACGRFWQKEVGVDADSVEWVTMEPKLRETFLLQGNVDAISGLCLLHDSFCAQGR